MKSYKINKVLAPIDFSDVSTNALETAVSISKKHGASLTIMHVLENSRFLYTPAGGLSAITLLPELLRTANEQLVEIASRIRDKHHIAVRHSVVAGNAAEGICQEAWSYEVDLVILGSHGTGNLRELLIGTTAYFVMKSCPAPVLAIPPDQMWIDFEKVLFPVRQNSHSLEKYEFAKPILKKENSSVLLAGLIDSGNLRTYHEVEIDVEGMYRRLVADDIFCRTQFFECNNLAQQVLEVANVEKPDLIVISTTIEGSLWDLFSVPYSKNVVTRSHFPVLSIRPRLEIEAQLNYVETVDERLVLPSLSLN